MRSRLGWKVPFRQVYDETFIGWLKATIWCHFVIRVFPFARDLESDALLEHYVERPSGMFEQYENTIKAIIAKRRGLPPPKNLLVSD